LPQIFQEFVQHLVAGSQHVPHLWLSNKQISGKIIFYRLLIQGLAISVLFGMRVSCADFDTAWEAYLAKDYTTALAEIEEGISIQDPDSLYLAAMIYWPNPHDESVDRPESDREKAMGWLEVAAEQGQPKAQSFLAVIYRDSQDYAAALQWARKAADQGESTAFTVLGQLYAFGLGVTQDHDLAIEYFQKTEPSVRIWNAQDVANKFLFGEGVTQDKETAARYFQVAADAGSAEAQFQLGVLHSGMLTGNVDYGHNFAEAERFYRLAAEQGHAGAQNNLGFLYLRGYVRRGDLSEGYMWLLLAQAQDEELAAENIERLLPRLNDAQKAKGEAEAKKWLSRNKIAEEVPEPGDQAAVNDSKSRAEIDAEYLRAIFPVVERRIAEADLQLLTTTDTESLDRLISADIAFIRGYVEIATWLYLTEAVENPNRPILLSNLAVGLHELSFTEPADPQLLSFAKELLQVAAAASPNDAVIQSNLGYVLLNSNMPGAARIHLEQAIELDPEQVLPFVHLAELAIQENSLAEAETMANRARKIDPLNGALIQLSKLYPAISPETPQACDVDFRCEAICPPGLSGQILRVSCVIKEDEAKGLCLKGAAVPDGYECRLELQNFGVYFPIFDPGLVILSPWGRIDLVLQGEGAIDFNVELKLPKLLEKLAPKLKAKGSWNPKSGVVISEFTQEVGLSYHLLDKGIANDLANLSASPAEWKFKASRIRNFKDGKTTISLGTELKSTGGVLARIKN
jgi:TPR repeat protein